jgi:hypothetical protein
MIVCTDSKGAEMLLGQSIFQSVLTRLKRERDDDQSTEAVAEFRVRGLGTGFVVSTTDEEPEKDAAGDASAYFADLADLSELQQELEAEAQRKVLGESSLPVGDTESETGPPQPVEPEEEPVPVHLTRLTTQEIAGELGIADADTEATLNDKRRKFAKTNHPDGVAERFRPAATTRMQIANLLIDQAIRAREIHARMFG